MPSARRTLSVFAVLSMLLHACGATEGPLLVRAAGEPGETNETNETREDDAVDPDGGVVVASAVAGPIQPGMTLQYQLVGALDESVEADVFVIDLFERTAEEVARLHAAGRVVVAYIAAGSHEPWRPDADDFPPAALGEALPGFPDERFLDVRDGTVRRVQDARLQLAAARGFDGVVLASLAAYAAQSGFPLTAADQLEYSLWLAARTHAAGLSAGLTSDWAQAVELAAAFDFAIHIGCLAEDRCADLDPYIDAGRPVFDLETAGTAEEVCPEAARLGLPVTLKRATFDAWMDSCR